MWLRARPDAQPATGSRNPSPSLLAPDAPRSGPVTRFHAAERAGAGFTSEDGMRLLFAVGVLLVLILGGLAEAATPEW